MNELAKDVKSSKEKGWVTLENREKLFEAGIVVFKLLLTKIKNNLNTHKTQVCHKYIFNGTLLNRQ